MRDDLRPGLYGRCQVDVEVRCLRRPVHSGQKGGPVPDAAQILCRMIADLSPPAPERGAGLLTVIAIESQAFHGCSNRITDEARARLVLRAPSRAKAREAGARLIRRLTRRPPYGAHVAARMGRPTPRSRLPR